MENKKNRSCSAFITNHSYLDNPTFRGMRFHLQNSFDEIFVLDLHGNALRKERNPYGGKDENVFDIKQGVSIIFAIKNKNSISNRAKIYNADVWGSRDEKYGLLLNNNIFQIQWVNINPSAPYYYFKQICEKDKSEYDQNWSIDNIFNKSSMGITSARDQFAYCNSETELHKRFNELIDQNNSDDDLLEKYNIHNTKSWDIKDSRQSIKRKINSDRIVKLNYRPFDNRWTYHTDDFLERPRYDVLRHFYHDNIGIVSLRNSRSQDEWNYCFVNQYPVDKSFITSLDNDFVYPLYIYPTLEERINSLEFQDAAIRKPNYSEKFIVFLCNRLNLKYTFHNKGDLVSTFGAEDVFNYIYSILNSPSYRKRYREFLIRDFPKIPFTQNIEKFRHLCKLGGELILYHILQPEKVKDIITTYSEKGNNKVEKVNYLNNNVWINERQFFGGISHDIWNFKIGGYQICEKWLKDRNSKTLNNEEINHYQKIVSINQTIRIMVEIDKTISSWPLE